MDSRVGFEPILEKRSAIFSNLCVSFSSSATVEGSFPEALSSSTQPERDENDNSKSKKGTVKRFFSGQWQTVGIDGFTANRGDWFRIAMDASDQPYIVYRDHGLGKKLSVMTFDGLSWTLVGSAGFTAGQGSFPDLTVDSQGCVCTRA